MQAQAAAIKGHSNLRLDPVGFANPVVLHLCIAGFTWKSYNTTTGEKNQTFKRKNFEGLDQYLFRDQT